MTGGRTLRSVASLLILLAFFACQEPAPRLTQVNPGTLQVTTRSGVNLEVLDWGGDGQALVFLAGGGVTAHSFDEFAPILTDDFRVFGITRRGMGASSDVRPKNFNDLLGDILSVLDALELGTATLVGHSFGGFEMTRFTERYGDRCAGLIYLDAAYDYAVSDLGLLHEETPPPEAPPMTRADSASIQRIQAWYERTQGFRPPESEVRAGSRFGPDGSYLGRKPITSTAREVARLERPAVDLGGLDCPSLGLFPVPGPLELWHPSYDAWNADERRRAGAWQEAYRTWVEETRDNFDRYPHNEVVEFPNTGHMFFLEQPEETASAIRDFVLGLR